MRRLTFTQGRILWIARSVSLGLLSVTTASAQILGYGLQKSVDEFTGTVICEQQVIDASHPNKLTIGVALDERGVVTFTLNRSKLPNEQVVSAPAFWEDEDGILFRFPNGEVVGHSVEDTDFDVVNIVDPNSWTQSHTLIIVPDLLKRMLSGDGDIRFCLIDTDEGGDRQHVDGTLTREHLAPLGAFYTECIGE